MDNKSKIYVAGHKGLVGSAIIRHLEKNNYQNIITTDIDLRETKEVDKFFKKKKPEYVFLAAAKVGGITYNKEFPADFIYDNLMIQSNLINAAKEYKTKKLMFLGSACVYPKYAPIPIREEYLMTSPLEETNIAYSISKIAGIIMAQKYSEQYDLKTICVMPNNLYGINDNFNLDECHVIPAMIRRFVEAKEKNLPFVKCYGDGTPIREFLFSDDLADALIFLMNNYDSSKIINVGPNREVSIHYLAELIAKIVGYVGEIQWDITKPNGTPRRVLETSKMDELGWKAQTSLEDGLKTTIEWFIANRGNYERI